MVAAVMTAAVMTTAATVAGEVAGPD